MSIRPRMIAVATLVLVSACGPRPSLAPPPSSAPPLLPVVPKATSTCDHPPAVVDPDGRRSWDEVVADATKPHRDGSGNVVQFVKCPNGDVIDNRRLTFGHVGAMHYVESSWGWGSQIDYFDARGALVGRSSGSENGSATSEGCLPPADSRLVAEYELCDPARHAAGPAAAAPPPPFRGFVTKTADPYQPCIVPLAETCKPSTCPTYESIVDDAARFVEPCPPKTTGIAPRPVMETGRVGDYRFVSIGGGYGGAVDWFDPSGTLSGEQRSSDALARHACSSDSAIYGNVPLVGGENDELPTTSFCLRAPDKYPDELFAPAWRNPAAPRKSHR